MPNISTIGPSISVPNVPEGPRVRPQYGLSEGLAAIGEGFDAIAQEQKARSNAKVNQAQDLTQAELSLARERAADDDDPDYSAVHNRYLNDSQEIINRHAADLTPEEADTYKKSIEPMNEVYGRGVSDRAFRKTRVDQRDRAGAFLSNLARDSSASGDGRIDNVMAGIAIERVRKLKDAGWINDAEAQLMMQTYESESAEFAVKRIAEQQGPVAARALLARPEVKRRIMPERLDNLLAGLETQTNQQLATDKAELEKTMKEIDAGVEDGGVPPKEKLDRAETLARARGDQVSLDHIKAAREGAKQAAALKRKPVKEAIREYNDMASGSTRSVSFIRHLEDFRATAYKDWNVAHTSYEWRVGHGSDTVTLADGTVQKTREGMKITKADADRDTARRIAGYDKDIVKDIGADAWAGLSGDQRAALDSLSHNYGHLPSSVAIAVKSGDAASGAAAIRGLKRGNILDGRRDQEAALFEGAGDTLPVFENKGAEVGIKLANASVRSMIGGLKDDPIKFARDNGYQVSPITFTDPASISERVRMAEGLAHHYGTDILPGFGTKYFDADERTGLAKEIKDADPEQKALLLANLEGAAGHARALLIYKELGQDAPVEMRFAALSTLGNPRAAKNGFRGMSLLADKGSGIKELMPKDEDVAVAEGEVLGDSFATNSEQRVQTVLAAKALLADHIASRGGWTMDDYKTYLAVAAGFNPDTGKGGVGVYNNHAYLLPTDMSEADVGAKLRNITTVQLADLSVSGAPPVYVNKLDGKLVPVTAEDVQNGVLIPSEGLGRYLVSAVKPGPNQPPQYFYDAKTGKAWEIDIHNDTGTPGTASTKSQDRVAVLSDQEQHLIDHHKAVVAAGEAITNADGTISTVLQKVVEHGGKWYSIPSVWGGKVLSQKESMARAAAKGWDYWPSYATPEEADARYSEIHPLIEETTPRKFEPPRKAGAFPSFSNPFPAFDATDEAINRDLDLVHRTRGR